MKKMNESVEILNQLQSKIDASNMANNMINDIFPTVINAIPEKRKRGRKALTMKKKQINKQERKEAQKLAKEAKSSKK